MSHRHFCDVTGHWWECGGAALRLGDKEPSVCICHACRAPLEQGDHARCKNRVELVACPEHRDEQRRMREITEKEHERRAAEFGLDKNGHA
jgi:predicted sulfurtransferase